MKFSTLSDNQQEVLEIIASHIKINGRSPSLRDIAKKTKNIKSLRGVAIQLDALEEAGYVTRSSQAKSISVNESLWYGNDDLIDIPLFTGTVQAGTPSWFEDHSDETIPVMLSATKGLRSVYAFKVRGESMIEKNIEDGDYAIVTELVNATNGDIVVASTREGITLKTYRVIDGHPILFPANKLFIPIVDDFEVRGKLINVIKPQMVTYYRQLRSFSNNSNV